MAFLRLIYFTARRKCPQFGFDRETATGVFGLCSKLENTLFSEEESKIQRPIAILRDYDGYASPAPNRAEDVEGKTPWTGLS
jgi:hypothetical protein